MNANEYECRQRRETVFSARIDICAFGGKANRASDVESIIERIDNRRSKRASAIGHHNCLAPAISDRVSVDGRMFEFSTEVVVVSADFLEKQIQVPVQVVNNANFVQCIKTSAPLQRLLLEGTPFFNIRQECLKATDVFESFKNETQ